MSNPPILSEHSLVYQESFKYDALRLFSHLINKPIRHLEIGVYQAGSALWMLENVLTHPDSRYMGIDDNIRSEVKHNLTEYAHRALVISGDSNRILPQLIELNVRFDTAYIDGCHYADWTMNDLVHTFKMLNSGGIILIDDYAHPEYRIAERIDNWITEHKRECQIVHKSYRIAIQKY